jgi:hypothetical protein
MGILDLFSKPKPVKKSGSKKLDNKVKKALKASGGKCVKCRKRNRKGAALFCSKCLKSIWKF